MYSFFFALFRTKQVQTGLYSTNNSSFLLFSEFFKLPYTLINQNYSMFPKDQENNILKGYNMLLYFAGSMIMYEPSEECIMDFWTKGNLKNLPVSSSNPNFIKAASQLRESCVDKNICGKMLREDYIRLFQQEGAPSCPCI